MRNSIRTIDVMKAFKLVLIFAVITYAIVGILFVLGTVTSDQALEYAGKATAVVAILGIAAAVIAKVSGSKSQITNDSKKSGPNF
jgi:hypothetical protein